MDKIQFFYAIKRVEQLAFDGRTYWVDEIVGDGHIVCNDMILCGKRKDDIKIKYKTKQSTTKMSRARNVPICQVCEKRYKENPRFQWKKWEQMVNETK